MQVPRAGCVVRVDWAGGQCAGAIASPACFHTMGVPAFFRWLQMKYPKTLVAVVEEDSLECEGGQLPGQNVDIAGPNPNHIEFDCLYVDMNGCVPPAPPSPPGPRVCVRTLGHAGVVVRVRWGAV